MNTIRTFIAVEIDSQTKQKISDLIASLKKSNADVKWVTKDQMHLTLKFLGNIEQNKVQEISDVLKSIAGNFKPFSISLSAIAGFPNLNRPKVIWLGIEKGAENLKKLNELIETGLEKIGFRKESREFNPHLTLGRVRTFKNISELTQIINENNIHNEVKINELILFQSTLTPKGSIYTPVSTSLLA